MSTKTLKGRLEQKLLIRPFIGTNKEINMNVPPHLLSFACSFTQEALGSCGRQRMIVVEVCSVKCGQAHFFKYFLLILFKKKIFLCLCTLDTLRQFINSVSASFKCSLLSF